MPSALAMTRSSGVVMKPRTKSAFAPTYTVGTCTTAISLRGSCRTLNERMDCKPAITITRLTTIDNTGRFMKRSVNFMFCCPCLAIFGLGSGTISRLDFVVDLHGGAIAQLEDARCDYLIARIQPRNNSDLISARAFQLDKLLLDAAVSLALGILEIGDDEDRVTVRGIVDGGGGQRDDRAICTHGQQHLNKHPRAQLTLGIRESRLHLDIPSGFVHLRVDRGNVAGEHLPRDILGGDA